MSDSFATPWTVVCQLLCPWDFPGKKYWSGLPFPSPGDLPNPGIESASSALQVDSFPLNHLGSLTPSYPSNVEMLTIVWVLLPSSFKWIPTQPPESGPEILGNPVTGSPSPCMNPYPNVSCFDRWLTCVPLRVGTLLLSYSLAPCTEL